MHGQIVVNPLQRVPPARHRREVADDEASSGSQKACQGPENLGQALRCEYIEEELGDDDVIVRRRGPSQQVCAHQFDALLDTGAVQAARGSLEHGGTTVDGGDPQAGLRRLHDICTGPGTGEQHASPAGTLCTAHR